MKMIIHMQMEARFANSSIKHRNFLPSTRKVPNIAINFLLKELHIICIKLLLNFDKHFIQEKSVLIHLNYHQPVFVITKNRSASKLWVESLKKVIQFQHFCQNIQFHFAEVIVVMEEQNLNQLSTIFMILQNHQVLKMKITSLLFGLLMLNRGQEDIPIN